MHGKGLIPEEFISEVLKHNDIVDVVGKYVHLTKQGKYLKGLCPFHSEKTPSFTVTPDKQIYHCYGCGASGNVIHFVMGIEGYSFPEAVKQLAEDVSLNFQWDTLSMERSPQHEAREQIIEAHELAAKLYHYILMNTVHGQEALAYLRERSFSDKLIEQFQMGYAPPQWDTLVQLLMKRNFPLRLMEQGGLISARHQQEGFVDRFRDRVMFPIWDRNGKVVGFSGRIMGEGQPKYLNSPETMVFNKSKLLYNLHQARPQIKRTGQVVLFEGFADVIQAWNGEVLNGVATMGTALTQEHVTALKRLTDRVVICFDGDDAGQASTLKSVPMLEAGGLHVAVAMLPDRLDPDEYLKKYGAERFRHTILAAAVTPAKFQLLSLRKHHTLLEDDGKRRYMDEAMKVIAPIDSPAEREMHLKELSAQVDISLEALKQECFEVRQKLQKMHYGGDNPDNWWNNDRNDKRSMAPPTLKPAYVYAEQRLLALMFQDAEVALYVEERLGEQFNVDDHAALAAYLYAYYTQGKEPDFSRFMATLHDDRLEQTAASISLAEVPLSYDHALLNDYIDLIKKVPRQREVESKKEQIVQAERAGDVLLAAKIAQEIIALEQELKR
ncbi:MAG: DNA primase [Paenibacillus sp.]|uniref:DNA primase n=1 Tax=Paenibacillus aquistagni TaxID=1852522 RepID=A0A1X7IE62_9BACL|nr:DNA primase [Paenibacillus aquistagni]MBR2568281.1 DNA primase [Paenibacillus sp.]SMG12853.1 DNA primase [Paenibacillus aquistagni]